jgi:hypothetical protein
MDVKLGALPGAYDNEMTYSEVLAINHFGTPTIPPRPVLRIAAERIVQNSPKTDDGVFTVIHNLIVNPKDSKQTLKIFLTSVGQQSVAEAKRIIDNITDLQENAPATVKKKKFNQPLYETGELEDHLGYEITD